MKLKPDLIRDLLSYSQTLGNQRETNITAIFDSPYLADYSWGELFSAISLLGEDGANLIDGAIHLKLGGSQISHIGPLSNEGNAYLSLISDPDDWGRIKPQTGVAPGCITLEGLYQLAKEQATSK